MNKTEMNFIDGISVIVPTYKREDLILRCLNSLYNQTLSKELFDVLIIINGEQDNTKEHIEDFIRKNNLNNIFIYEILVGNASIARNEGIKKARRNHIVFLDDDDFLSKNYLERMLHYASEDVVAISQIVNVDQKGKENFNTTINLQIMHYENDSSVDYMKLDKVATINACKILPTKYIRRFSFDSRLKSGEDVVFFTNFFLKTNLKFKIIPSAEKVIYYRVVSSDSISRQSMSFNFNVQQRLSVIKNLDCLLKITKKTSDINFIKSKMTAQFLFINNYYLNNKNEKDKILEEISKHNLSFIPFNLSRGITTWLKYYVRKVFKIFFK